MRLWQSKSTLRLFKKKFSAELHTATTSRHCYALTVFCYCDQLAKVIPPADPVLTWFCSPTRLFTIVSRVDGCLGKSKLIATMYWGSWIMEQRTKDGTWTQWVNGRKWLIEIVIRFQFLVQFRLVLHFYCVVIEAIYRWADITTDSSIALEN